MTGPIATGVVVVLAVGAVFFTGVAVVGLVRLPDCYARAHATSKSDTLGTMCALGSAAVVFGVSRASVKLAVLVLFVLMTGPTAAHAISRSAYDQGVEPTTGETGTERLGDEDSTADGDTTGGETA